ncbi:MAG: hypothetical protein NTW96_23015 [Planctomycetia bacterium]|nr:hypothetical protein [Planctomycetia bacterium]
MLSGSQVNSLVLVSGAAFGGLIVGALCGLLVGAAARALKTHASDGLFVGFFLGVIPGAMVASTVAISIAVIQTIVFQPEHKGDYHHVPDWFVAAQWSGVVAAGGFASCLAARRDRRSEKPKREVLHVLLWGFGGGILTSFALVGLGFDGYFVVQSNSGPLRCAILGFVFGSVIVALWRVGVATLIDFQTRVGTNGTPTSA